MSSLTRSMEFSVCCQLYSILIFILKGGEWFLKTYVAFYFKLCFYLLREKFRSHVEYWVKMSIYSFTRIVARASLTSVLPKYMQHETG